MPASSDWPSRISLGLTTALAHAHTQVADLDDQLRASVAMEREDSSSSTRVDRGADLHSDFPSRPSSSSTEAPSVPQPQTEGHFEGPSHLPSAVMVCAGSQTTHRSLWSIPPATHSLHKLGVLHILVSRITSEIMFRR